MSNVREKFNPVPMAADATYVVKGQYIGGFLAKTAGTITVISKDPTGTTDITYVDAVPVSVGVYTPIPLEFPAIGGTVTLAGGASGTLFI